MTLLARRLRAGYYEEVALSLALGLARALAKLPPDGLEGLLEVLEGAGTSLGPLHSGSVGARSPRPSGQPPRAKARGRGEETSPLQHSPSMGTLPDHLRRRQGKSREVER